MKLIHCISPMLLISVMMPGLAQAGGHGGGHAGHSAAHSHATYGTGAKSAKTPVTAYTKKSGTKVAAHNRSTKDATQRNNWSAKGNVNPDTGKVGTKPVTK